MMQEPVYDQRESVYGAQNWRSQSPIGRTPDPLAMARREGRREILSGVRQFDAQHTIAWPEMIPSLDGVREGVKRSASMGLADAMYKDGQIAFTSRREVQNGMSVEIVSARAYTLHPDLHANAQQAIPRPEAEWHEDMGNMLWWRFPIEEPPYCGMPIDTDWPGYHTHFTAIPIPQSPS